MYIVYIYIDIWVYIYIYGFICAKGPYTGRSDQLMQDLPHMSSDIDSRRKLHGGAAG